MNEVDADRYGVMGYPVSHSRSPIIHRLFAQQTHQHIQYELIEVAPDKLDAEIDQFGLAGGKGLNITVPHKHEVARLVDDLSERASNAGAVNTITLDNGRLYGDNTDGVGLLRDLQVNHNLKLKDSNILILGAGGATRGIIGPLLEAEPASIVIANRTFSKARSLADHFSTQGPVDACRFDEVRSSPNYDLIINATSAGLSGEIALYPEHAVHPSTCCYDLSYSDSPTPFARWATQHGAASSIMGWGMLVEQAAESFFIWRGIQPDTAPVLKQLTTV